MLPEGGEECVVGDGMRRRRRRSEGDEPSVL